MQSSCAVCNKQFSYASSQQTGKTCSLVCRGILKNRNAVESGTATPKAARLYMLRHTRYECAECKVSTWRDKPITLQVDHIDGNVKNSRPENLRWMCPNCHSQTRSWGSSNIKEENRHRLKTMVKGNKRITKFGTVA